MAWICYAGYCR